MASATQQQRGTTAKSGAPIKLKQIGDTQLTVTKSEKITALLRRAKGASINELMNATGWLAHSVRGFLSGTIRKRKGLTISNEKTGGERRYRIVEHGASS